MASELGSSSSQLDRQWFIAERWQEYEGEARANLLRIIGIGAFYLVELLNYYGLNLGWLQLEPVPEVNREFHFAITILAVAWAMMSLAVFVALKQRVFPKSFKFITTGLDILLLTSILTLADGPRSPLIVGYLLLIVLAAMRFSVPLIRCATLGCMVGYLFLLGYAKWAVPDRHLQVPRYQQIIFLLSLALTGIVVGQIIRRTRRMAEDFRLRMLASEEKPS